MVTIHQETCTGCALCVKDCVFGNLEMRNGKAAVKGDYIRYKLTPYLSFCVLCFPSLSFCDNDGVNFPGVVFIVFQHFRFKTRNPLISPAWTAS